MSRIPFALVASTLAVGCMISFDGYRAREETSSAGDAGNAAAGAGRGGMASGGNAGDGGDGSAEGGVSAEGGAGSNAGGQMSSAGTGGGAGTAGAAGTGGAPTTCPALPQGPGLIEIPKPGGGFYCVDRTEVSVGQYAQFLGAAPEIAAQDAECTWNDSFDPECDDVPTAINLPVTCIDWCDAKKFCEWANKELCGSVAGGSIAPADFADQSQDAWFAACSEHGQREFPYGSSYDGEACNGVDAPTVQPEAVGTTGLCQGGYPGLYDMSGNVSEWENSCTGASGAADECLHRGGSVFDADSLGSTGQTLRCNSSGPGDITPSPATTRRDTRSELIGLRCCYIP